MKKKKAQALKCHACRKPVTEEEAVRKPDPWALWRSGDEKVLVWCRACYTGGLKSVRWVAGSASILRGADI